MSNVRAAVQTIIGSVGDATARMSKLQQLVADLCVKKDVEPLKQLVDMILSDDSQFSLFSRPVLHELAVRMAQMPPTDIKNLATHALEKLKGRVVSYEEEDSIIREHLAGVLQNEGAFADAAKVLSQINLESGTRARTSMEKASKYIQIAELYLEEEDSVSADTYCNRAGHLIHDVPSMSLQLRYKVCYARILDSKRKFLEAAQRFYELSQNTLNVQVDPQDLVLILTDAVTCAILAPAGPQRSRLLASLMKDERISQVASHEVVKKMFLERILKMHEVHRFKDTLKEHHKARLADGQTVLDKAMLQHNVLAASKVYKNMKLQDLGLLLEVDPTRAEKVAAQMIQEKRLDGHIDQMKGTIHFGSAESERLKAWDLQIQAVCHQVNYLIQRISKDESKAQATAMVL